MDISLHRAGFCATALVAQKRSTRSICAVFIKEHVAIVFVSPLHCAHQKLYCMEPNALPVVRAVTVAACVRDARWAHCLHALTTVRTLNPNHFCASNAVVSAPILATTVQRKKRKKRIFSTQKVKPMPHRGRNARVWNALLHVANVAMQYDF